MQSLKLNEPLAFWKQQQQQKKKKKKKKNKKKQQQQKNIKTCYEYKYSFFICQQFIRIGYQLRLICCLQWPV